MADNYTSPSPCGTICDTCPWFNGAKKIKCQGCQQKEPFWGRCATYECANKHGVEHCGLCEKFPCDTLINQYDPNNPKGPQAAIFRIGQLAIRTQLGTKEWLKKRKDGTLPNFKC